jgi:AraC-like DNA-binding protein
LKAPDERLLEKIKDCIRKNISNSDLNIDMISVEVGISRVHLHRKMKELT